VDADYKVRSAEISGLLVRLANESSEKKTAANEELEKRIATDVQIAAGTSVPEKNILDLGQFTSFTCPECHGSLIEIKEEKFSRFRCHTGHGFSEDALLEAVTQSTGEMTWQVTRGLQETVMLLQHMGGHLRDADDFEKAGKFFVKARELEKRASQMQKLAIEQERLSHENLGVDKIQENNS
jgi:two-component system chemotaxis response regulator CheB